jgi:hypothetical protein
LNAVGGIVKRCEKLGEGTLRVASDNHFFQTQVLTHQNDNLYENEDGRPVKLCSQGRVICPTDTSRVIRSLAAHDTSGRSGRYQNKDSDVSQG